MSINEDSANAYIKSFEARIESMAWEVVGKILEDQKNKVKQWLISKEVSKKAAKKLVKKVPTKTGKAALLNSRKGTWSRGHGAFKILGPGKVDGTLELQNINTGKKINSTKKTLLSKWKHFS